MVMDATTEWLLEGDAAIRWQVLRDLTSESANRVQNERSRVSSEGWGVRLLDAQDSGGTWGGGLYTPKWTSTTYTLLLLRRLGLEPGDERARRGAQLLLDRADWVEGGVSFWKTHRLAEICVNGMVLSIAAHFRVDDPRLDDIVALLVRRQLDDGGWNCDFRSDGRHSSFHTTISVLEALAVWIERHKESSSELWPSMERAWEFFAEHRLFRSHRTGEIIDPRWTRFSFPPRWYYDVLRGLDHLASCGAPVDDRYDEGIELVLSRRTAAGRWKLQNRHRGQKEHFSMEPVGTDSRWNTLRALRVLKWCDAA